MIRRILSSKKEMYMTELPGMNYAANTGKQSKFLERCVTNGKYRTLLLKSGSAGNSGKRAREFSKNLVQVENGKEAVTSKHA